ncbi:hypothetical protein FA15DRAFT_586054, partial [Coprinopsis marcescibilis]
ASVPVKTEKQLAIEREEEDRRLLQSQLPEPRSTTPKEKLLHTPSPKQYDFPQSYVDHQSHLKRRDSSVGYYSEAESFHSARHRSHPTRRAHTDPSPPSADPRHSHNYHDYRHRNSSFSQPKQQSPPQPSPPIINKSNYVKAYVKEVPMKPEAIALSWQLVDYESRKSKRYPALYFDAGFDPRFKGYEVTVMRYGEPKLSVITRDEATQLVSPHAFITELTLYHEVMRKWPVVVRNPKGVRCIDIFRAIYDTYAVPLTPEELVQCGEEYIERCQPWFDQRCRDGPQFEVVERSKGLKRIDLLRGKRVFKGLVQNTAPGAPEYSWILHLERQPSPNR